MRVVIAQRLPHERNEGDMPWFHRHDEYDAGR